MPGRVFEVFTRHEWDGAPQRDQLFGPRYIARSVLIRNTLNRVGPATVLDIGCGSGNITRHVAACSGRVHAIDLSPQAIEVASASLADVRNITYEAFDVFGASEEERSHLTGQFNLIVLSEVLEHLDEDEAALTRIRELLPEGGYFLLTVPGDPSQWSIDDDLSGHKRRYTREELSLKLHRAGFEIRNLINWGFPFTRALMGVERRLMGAGQGDGEAEDGQTGGSSLPPPLRLLLRPARFVFRINAAVEPLFSFADRGVGYVVLAQATRAPVQTAQATRRRSTRLLSKAS